MTTHSDHKYSITIHSDDLAIINCLRALSKFSQKTGNNQIPWGGTKDRDWEKEGHKVTFRFSETRYRDIFVSEITRLLPSNLWQVASQSENDPAYPQS